MLKAVKFLIRRIAVRTSKVETLLLVIDSKENVYAARGSRTYLLMFLKKSLNV